jgi:hypothetical protein
LRRFKVVLADDLVRAVEQANEAKKAMKEELALQLGQHHAEKISQFITNYVWAAIAMVNVQRKMEGNAES